MHLSLTRGKKITLAILGTLILGSLLLFFYAKDHREEFAAGGFAIFEKVSQLLPLEADTKKEIEAIGTLVSALSKQDDTTRTFFLMLQNNYELRPGGGFLGQYAILKIKNGKIISFDFEDANLLDQRIKNAKIKITPPWPLTRYAQIKRWMLRDSNFSPDFPTNANKVEYFYRLGGGREKLDGVIAINADVLNHIIGVVGPITIDGFGTYTAENAAIDLEEDVEKAYLGEEVPAAVKENRKNVMKRLAAEIVSRVSSLSDIQKLSALGLEELRSKNIQLFFKDPELQKQVEEVHWDGSVSKNWNKDYLMIVDANLGALKTDYYIRRSLEYTVDFTGEKPKATVLYSYNHTATAGNWRTSDYHTYTRILAPSGSKYIEESRVKTGGVSSQESPEWNKMVFGYKVDALIGTVLPTSISYELPASITPDNYELLIQKQSGTGTIPVKVTLKTKDREYIQNAELLHDLRFSIRSVDKEKK